MFLIVGLGNPGKDYANTYHNMGFMVVDKLSDFFGVNKFKKKCDALIGEGIYKNEKILLAYPQTYMNNSGVAVKKIMQYYKIPISNIVVIYDDIDIELGNIRYRESGSAGTHNGMKSVVNMLQDTNFKRIRIGIGKPDGDLINFVLGQVNAKSMEILKSSFDKAINKVVEILNEH